MVKIVVVGGGLSGLAAGMLFAGDGHQVEVLERDEAEPPDPELAWQQWARTGVRQLRLAHFFLPPFHRALAAELPSVVAALDAAGALRMNPIDGMPSALSGGWRDGDERFEALTGSRPMVEAVIARCAAETPGLWVRRGVAVASLHTVEGSDPVAVSGVVTSEGETITADLVVDAAGRHSAMPRMLAAAGAATPIDEAEDSGFVYYGRAFRSDDGSLPFSFGGGLQPYGSISTLTLGADNGTWAVAFVASGRDKAMRGVRDIDTFEKVWRSYPLVAHWIDGEPLDDGVAVMGNLEDRIRHDVFDGVPVATGVVTVGDAWACTNPSVGRGVSLGMLQLVGLRNVLREVTTDDPLALSLAWWRWRRDNVEPFYRETVRGDRHRRSQIEAAIDRSEYQTDDPVLAALDTLPGAVGHDPDLLRLWLDAFMMNRLADDLLADPGLRARIDALAADAEPAPGLSRDGLEALLAG